jgi:hypothetical protein
MSANLALDLGGTCLLQSTLPPNIGTIGSGGFVDAYRSGIMIGQTVDMINADTYCNVLVLGTMVTSGPLLLAVQDSDSTTSGNFTDPTSGLPQFPQFVSSGGQVYIGQSGTGANYGTLGAFVSGQSPLSGFAVAFAFQRKQRYVRVNMQSGFYAGPLQVAVLGNLKYTGSGGGYNWYPGSGTAITV